MQHNHVQHTYVHTATYTPHMCARTTMYVHKCKHTCISTTHTHMYTDTCAHTPSEEEQLSGQHRRSLLQRNRNAFLRHVCRMALPQGGRLHPARGSCSAFGPPQASEPPGRGSRPSQGSPPFLRTLSRMQSSGEALTGWTWP